MASKRELKKDIDAVTYSFVYDCYEFIDLYPEADTKKIYEMIENALDLQAETVAQVNSHTNAFSAKEVKEHFKNTKTTFLNQMDTMYQKLNELFEAQTAK